MSTTDDETLILAESLIAEYPPQVESAIEVVSVAPLASDLSPEVSPLAITGEPVIHGLVGAQFGDLEYDVGKSVRWLEFFVDDLFITDINTGEQRYWVINWTESFPDSEHVVTGRNFFYNKTEAALWRKEQFEAAARVFGYEEHDWVLFVDGHEGISFDNRSLPDDYDAAPFKSWLYREIERAVERGQTSVYLPFFVYLKYSDLQNISYATEADSGGLQLGIPPVSQGVSVPWYLPAGWMPRLFQVAALRGPAFDWSILDTPVTTPPAGETSYLTPTIGTVSTPDPGVQPKEFTLVFDADPLVTTSGNVVAGQWGAMPGWFLGREPTNDYVLTLNGPSGQIYLGSAPFSATARVNATSINLNDGTNSTMRSWSRNADGTWTPGVFTSTAAPLAPPHDMSAAVRIGALDAAGNYIYDTPIYWVECRSGLDPAAGTVLWRFDASEYPGSGTSYVDPRGRTWTLTNASAIHIEPRATDLKAQLISYGYAHWNIQDIPPGETQVPALSASNDDGYKMRNLLSRVRPISGIPYGDTWQPPSTDPATLPGPWCVDTMSNVDPTVALTVEEKGHAAPAAATAGLRIPLYDTVMRLNLRDGLWYERGVSGNIPLTWDEVNQVWVPNYTPEEWEALGTDATDEPRPGPSTMSLRLNGTAGSYARTLDSPFLDYRYSVSIMSVLAMSDWTPASRRILVSKWGAAAQRSYYWGLDPDGLVLALSRDGTNAIEHKIVHDLGLADWEPAALGVSFTADITTLQDEVRFWRYDPQTLWNQIGDTQIVANPDYVELFNSNTELQIGAHSGNVGNVSGLFRLVSIRMGVGEANAFGGTEVALMRGDLTGNPTYDRYGNVWSNHGTWSYEPMVNPPL